MSYRKPGFYEVPAGNLLPRWANRVMGKGEDGFGRANDTWATDMGEVFSSLGRGGRFVKDLTIEDVLGMKGSGSLAAGTPAYHALLQLLIRFLHKLGVLDAYPAVVGYAGQPILQMDEIIDNMMSSFIVWPDWPLLGNEMGFKLEALKGVFATMVRQMGAMQRMRGVLVSRLRQKLGAIAYKVATSIPIDQSERSFWAIFGDVNDRRGWTRLEQRSGAAPVVHMTDTGDPLVNEAWELFKTSTEVGPFLRFCSMVSNTSFENLVYWMGPQMSNVVFSIGYVFEYGPFDRPEAKESITLPWGKDDQLRAARERHIALKAQGLSEVLGVHSPIQAASALLPTVEPVFDLPNVEFLVDIEKTLTQKVEAMYYSTWRERMVSTLHGATPGTMMLDLALTTQRIGESQLGELSVLSWPLLDSKESEPYLGRQTTMKPNWASKILLPSASRQLSVKEVDMRDYYVKLGTTVWPPAFREAVLSPLNWLYIPDAPAEDFIASRLGLTVEQRKQAEQQIRICHNWNNLNRLLAPVQLPLDYDRLKALIGAISGY